MIDLSFIKDVCTLLNFAFKACKYIFNHRKQISHLLHQMANKLCDFIKKINHKKVSK